MKKIITLLSVVFCFHFGLSAIAQPGIDWVVSMEDTVLIQPNCITFGHNNLIAIGGEIFDPEGDSSDFHFMLRDLNGSEVISKRYQTDGWGQTECVMDVLTCGDGYLLSGSSYLNGLDPICRWHLFRIDAQGDTVWHRIYDEYADWTKTIVLGENIYVIGAGNQENDSCQLVIRKIDLDGETVWNQSHWIDNIYFLRVTSVALSVPFLAISGDTYDNCFLAYIDSDGGILQFTEYSSDLERIRACELITFEENFDNLVYIGSYQSIQGSSLNMHAFSTRGDWRTLITDLEGYNYPAAAIPVEDGFVVAGSIQHGMGDVADYFLARLNFEGGVQWRTSFELEGNDWCRDLVALEDGSYLIVGAGNPSKLVKTTPDPLYISKTDLIQQPLSLTLSTYPSPFNSSAFVSFRSPFTGDVRASLVDVNGRVIREYWKPAFAGMMNHGNFRVDGSGLAAGTYWLRFEQNGRAAMKRLSLVK